MRHKKKRVMQLDTGTQKRSNVVRNLLTSLFTHGQIVTTVKRSKALKSKADSLLNSLLSCYDKYDGDEAVKREMIRRVTPVIYTEEAGKKLVNDIVPALKEAGKATGFVRTLKLGLRPGDSAEKVLVTLS